MRGPSNRFVVIISALLTLFVLGAATLAVGFRNGRLRVATDAPSRDAVTADAPHADPERGRTLPTAREANPSPARESGADRSEVVLYREKLEEAYRALDDAYAQIRSLQTAQPQVAGDRLLAEHDGDDDRGRGSRGRESRRD